MFGQQHAAMFLLRPPSSLRRGNVYLVAVDNELLRVTLRRSTKDLFPLDFSQTKSVLAPAGFPVQPTRISPCAVPRSLPDVRQRHVGGLVKLASD